jgi:hypothetical protein
MYEIGNDASAMLSHESSESGEALPFPWDKTMKDLEVKEGVTLKFQNALYYVAVEGFICLFIEYDSLNIYYKLFSLERSGNQTKILVCNFLIEVLFQKLV